MPSKIKKVNAPAQRWGRIEDAATELIKRAITESRKPNVEYMPVPVTAINRLVDALNIKVTPWQ